MDWVGGQRNDYNRSWDMLKYAPNCYKMSTQGNKVVSMTTLMEHSGAQPRECTFLPKKLMSTNKFFIGLVLGCA